MKAVIFILFIILISCAESSKTENEETTSQPVSVFLGDSITMGIQDAGLKRSFQENSFPFLIAKQMGIVENFTQPWVSDPGFGIPPYRTPLFLDEDMNPEYEIWAESYNPAEIVLEISELLENQNQKEPYNNLGINGARLFDLRNTTFASEALSKNNIFFDIVLRNSILFPESPKTVIEQAKMLSPDYIFLWIGSNDILTALLNGGDSEHLTEKDEFEDEYTGIVKEIKSMKTNLIIANIPPALPFENTLNRVFIDGTAMLFDFDTIQPINFGTEEKPLYIPILVEEQKVSGITLFGLMEMMETGAGIPDSETLVSEGVDYSIASELTEGREKCGTVLAGEFTVTNDERSSMIARLNFFNSLIKMIAEKENIPLVDIRSLLDPTSENPFAGYSGEHILLDPERTVFSIDGVHPNNLGHAIIANEFIKVLNENYKTAIPLLDPEKFKGQYVVESENTSP